jgi:transcriptional regulator with XRE-family HTH domain
METREEFIRKIIGEKLKKFRKMRKLSVWKAAQIADVNISTIKAVEGGETNYTIDTFFKYIQACDLYIYFAEKDKKVEPHDFDDLLAKSK